jgi:hypothetical protein
MEAGAMEAGAMEAGAVLARAVLARAVGAGITALGVFFGFEVLDFDFLSFFCCHLSFLSGWLVLLCPWRRRAIDARL